MVGVGTISKQYLEQFPSLPDLRLTAVADLDSERAAAVAAQQGVQALGVDELLASDDVDVVLNLTIPAAHADVALRALAAGKHVYGEKPLALSTAEAAPVLAAAEVAGLRVGSAPDTVLGTGVQTARAALDEGHIGTPVGAAVSWSAPGHELWHPAPGFYYQPGGGPLLDMGPYYLTSLVTFFGSVVRVSGSTTRSTRQRTVATGPDAGRVLPVDVDTHVVAVLEHEGGVVSTMTVSFEVWATEAPLFEVHGTAGSLSVADPNRFSDPTRIATAEDRTFRELPELAGHRDAGRGVGLADMARAIASGGGAPGLRCAGVPRARRHGVHRDRGADARRRRRREPCLPAGTGPTQVARRTDGDQVGFAA
ncbi:Gfo/Idh/MocA family oxidoreductase [Curtobacterium sp. MCJR17_043]|uniref:Gfo/Idh/MocA family protein n=1 Tax=Curtobacterium sp. MCJR17_043 TaxID=2175660 RepID=UPI0024DF6F83|nr:Gfo/Idh/MocA family oxidoreductase [Curtobacterium sp. MCJR17_043]WIB37157.1 Gfo/Idh/MocA family oxidoreductase [Curtobacterium sp. MCJR17_043]